jgi:hypothetical protein
MKLQHKLASLKDQRVIDGLTDLHQHVEFRLGDVTATLQDSLGSVCVRDTPTCPIRRAEAGA